MAKLDTASKAWYRLLELKRVYDKMASKKAEDLTPKQMSWLEKIGNFLWVNWIWDIWAPANGIAKVASMVTPNDWRMPRWGSTNATRTNPYLWFLFPRDYWQGWVVEPDSWQINNAFNMKERVATWKEWENDTRANWERMSHNWAEDQAFKIAVWVYGYNPFVYWTIWLPIDAAWTLYASLRNWYNAIADYYNKHKAKDWGDKWVEDYLATTKKQIDEAEKYYNKIADAKKNYIDYYLPWDSEDTDYPAFDDYVRKAVDADTLYYIKTKLDKWADDVDTAAIDQAVDYNNSKKTPTKAALKTRDQIMIWLWKNPYASAPAVAAEPVEYLWDRYEAQILPKMEVLTNRYQPEVDEVADKLLKESPDYKLYNKSK